MNFEFKFKVGDLVTLKSGGPVMTVIQLNLPVIVEPVEGASDLARMNKVLEKMLAEPSILCMYWEDGKVEKKHCLHPDCLVFAGQPTTIETP